jgi:hypothetical protein
MSSGGATTVEFRGGFRKHASDKRCDSLLTMARCSTLLYLVLLKIW